MLFLSTQTPKILIYIETVATKAPKTGLSGTTGLRFITPAGAIATPTNGLTELDSTNAKGWYSVLIAGADTMVTGEWVLSYQTSATAADIGSVRFMVNGPVDIEQVGGTAVVSSSGRIGAAVPVQKNVALTVFPFLMTDAAAHAPATGKTVTCTRSIDGGAFGAGTLANVAEVANGIYTVDFGAGDLNGKSITLRATAAGCDDTLVVLNPGT